MNNKLFKIALKHIQSQTEDTDTETTPQDPEKMVDNLSDKRILEITTESIKANYPTLINIKLKQVATYSVPEAFMVADFIIKRFHDSDTPTKEFDAYFANLKIKLLREVYDLALADRKSIKDLTLRNFKKNPTDNEEVVDDYVRELLGNARIETVAFIRKLNSLKNT